MNTKVLLVLIFGLALLGAVFFVLFGNENKETVTRQDNAIVSDREEVSESAPSETAIETADNYKDYSSEALATAQQEGRVVLFFHASWCPTCRALEDEIKTGGFQLPEDVTVLKVDYDSERDLKNQYTVVTQHTLVLLDDEGDEIDKVVGADLAGVVGWLEENS